MAGFVSWVKGLCAPDTSIRWDRFAEVGSDSSERIWKVIEDKKVDVPGPIKQAREAYVKNLGLIEDLSKQYDHWNHEHTIAIRCEDNKGEKDATIEMDKLTKPLKDERNKTYNLAKALHDISKANPYIGTLKENFDIKLGIKENPNW